jgi:hypothetical protein
MRALALIALVACSSPPPLTAVTKPAPPQVPMSDPAEYTIERISRDAGKAIFGKTGIGDPYRTGVPYPIFLALVAGYPKTFGGSLDALAHKFGFVTRTPDARSNDLDDREGLPVGMHLTIDPITNVPFVVTNCALCHAERLRWPGGEAFVVGLANKRVRVHAYDEAFAEIAGALSVDKLRRLAAEAADAHHVAWPERYRDVMLGATIDALKKRAADRRELFARTHDGPPGRVATIETFAFTLEQLTGKGIGYQPTVGWAKVPDVIGFPQRVSLSWDGSGEGPMDLLAVEADVAAGVRVEWLERHPFQGASLGAYLRQPESRPRFPRPIDHKLAERGRTLFDDNCAHCHGHYGADGRALDYDESIVPLEDIGTDPARAQAATETFERAANDPLLTRGYTKFRRTFGYVPPVLTNVWMRAPYGHAGQWPSLAVIATPPAQRTTRFVVDLDAPYDLAAVGVETHADGPGYLHDASKPGFSVAGHPFLADLGKDAAAVIEYLKTL